MRLRARSSRKRGTARLVVDAPGARPGWTAGLPGVRVHSVEGTCTVLELDDGVDDQRVLAAALATGPVREFARRLPTLAELFRGVVAEDRA